MVNEGKYTINWCYGFASCADFTGLLNSRLLAKQFEHHQQQLTWPVQPLEKNWKINIEPFHEVTIAVLGTQVWFQPGNQRKKHSAPRHMASFWASESWIAFHSSSNKMRSSSLYETTCYFRWGPEMAATNLWHVQPWLNARAVANAFVFPNPRQSLPPPNVDQKWPWCYIGTGGKVPKYIGG